jgi:hypothetical protein
MSSEKIEVLRLLEHEAPEELRSVPRTMRDGIRAAMMQEEDLSLQDWMAEEPTEPHKVHCILEVIHGEADDEKPSAICASCRDVYTDNFYCDECRQKLLERSNEQG